MIWEYAYFGGNFETFLMSMIDKMQIIVIVNNFNGLILGTDMDQLHSSL